MTETRYIAELPPDTPSAYWENYWEFVETRTTRTRDGEYKPCTVIRSKRTGRDAEYDHRVLIDRLASGLHFCYDVREEEVPEPESKKGVWPMSSQWGAV